MMISLISVLRSLATGIRTAALQLICSVGVQRQQQLDQSKLKSRLTFSALLLVVRPHPPPMLTRSTYSEGSRVLLLTRLLHLQPLELLSQLRHLCRLRVHPPWIFWLV